MTRRSKLLLAGSIVLLEVTAASLAWWWLRKDDQEQELLLRPIPAQLAPGLYLLGNSLPSAVYVVETTDGLVLVDSGRDPEGFSVTRQITRLGLDPAQIRAVLLTHAHADHSLGAMHFRQTYGARIYAGRGDCPVLRAGGPREGFFSIFPAPGVKPHPIEVDVELVGGEVIEIGDARFQVLATPGHTPGSVCYLLERNRQRVLFTGDVIMSLSDEPADSGPMSVRGPLGTYAAHLAPRYRGSARDYLATLRKLRELPAPDLVLPGHPRIDLTPQNPRISPDRWLAMLDQGIAELQDLLARYATNGENFLDGIPKQILLGLHYLGDYGGLAVYCMATPAGLVLFDAPGGPGLVDFLESKLRAAGLESVQIAAVLLTSCGPEATAGLGALVEKTGCCVVASKAGRRSIEARCPPGAAVLSEDDLLSAGWLKGRALPLKGLGVAPMAYQLRWQGKTVLVSGRIPMKINRWTALDLAKALAGSDGDAKLYLQSLRQLGALKPDIWLPSAPLNGQNASLGRDEWAETIADNERATPHTNE